MIDNNELNSTNLKKYDSDINYYKIACIYETSYYSLFNVYKELERRYNSLSYKYKLLEKSYFDLNKLLKISNIKKEC